MDYGGGRPFNGRQEQRVWLFGCKAASPYVRA